MTTVSLTKPLDFDARYMVDGYGGIAFYLTGYVQVRDRDEDGEWDGELVDDPDWVVAVMVGDDRPHTVEVDSLTKLAADAYCNECGQIGCGWTNHS